MPRNLTGANLLSQASEIDASRPENVAPAIAGIYSYLKSVAAAINGKLSFGAGLNTSNAGNLDGQFIRLTAPAIIDTTFTIVHDLGRVPAGYIVVSRDRACVVYDSSIGSWSTRVFYLKCDTADVDLLLIVF